MIPIDISILKSSANINLLFLTDEREGNKDKNIEDPASQTFLRNEIKTVGKETEAIAIENSPDKRPHITSSPDVETDPKRRRLEGPFGKHTKESSLDILQVLQEKNSSNTLSPISPDFVPDKVQKPLFTFGSTSGPAPPVIPMKRDTKTDKTISKDKNLLSPPKQKSFTSKQSSPSSEKTPDKSKTNVLEGSSSKKGTSPSIPSDKSLQLKFSKPKTPKKDKSKASPAESQLKPKEQPNLPQSSLKPVISKPSQSHVPTQQEQLMPKLIIKPMKLEKNQTSEYSVSSVPVDENLGSEKSKTSVSSSLMAGDLKPKKKKKKKGIDILPSQPPDQAFPVHVPLGDSGAEVASTSSSLLSPSSNPKLVGEVTKKKKKKHKEKDREKSKPKKVIE